MRDMYGNDLTKTDSFGTPRGRQGETMTTATTDCQHERTLAYTEDNVRYHACRDCRAITPLPDKQEQPCKRCATPLKGGFCTDETCPFSDYTQDDPRGWAGHPDAPTQEQPRAFWDHSFIAQADDEKACVDCYEGESAHEQQPTPPARLWVRLTPTGGTISYVLDPREIHDNGKPVYEYVLVERKNQ